MASVTVVVWISLAPQSSSSVFYITKPSSLTTPCHHFNSGCAFLRSFSHHVVIALTTRIVTTFCCSFVTKIESYNLFNVSDLNQIWNSTLCCQIQVEILTTTYPNVPDIVILITSNYISNYKTLCNIFIYRFCILYLL